MKIIFSYQNTKLFLLLLLISGISGCVSSEEADSLTGTSTSSAASTPASLTAASRLVASATTSSTQVGSCYGPITIESVNSFMTVTPVTTTALINLAVNGAGSFFSDAACTSLTFTSSIGAGSSTASVYFVGNTSGFDLLYFNSTSLTGATFPLNVLAGSPTRIVLSGPSTLGGATCSSAFTATLVDSTGSIARATALTTVNLSGAGSGAFYSDATCSTVITSRSIAINSESATFYFKDPASENLNLVAAATGLTSGTLGLAVSAPAAPTKLLLASNAQTTTTGVCYGPLSISTTDSGNTLVAVQASTTIGLSGAGAGAFYSDNGCSSAITSITFNTGTATGSFYFKDSTTENVLFAATATGLTTSTLPFNISASAATKLAITGSSTLGTGQCSGVMVVTLQDNLNNTARATSAMTVNLTGAGSGSFYSDSACTSAISSFSIAINGTSGNIYFKDNTAEVLTLTAQAAGVSNGTLSLTLSAGTPTQLAITAPSSTAAGLCTSAFTIQSQDTDGNISPVTPGKTVTFSGQGGGSFYSDPTCVTPIASTTISSGTSSVTVYFLNTTSGTFSLGASATGLVSSTVSYTVTPNTLYALTVTGTNSVSSYACSSPIVVTTVDVYGNPYPVNSDRTFNLSGEGSGGTFYSDAACTSAITSSQILTGASTRSVYFKGTVAGSRTFTASSGSLVNGTMAFTIVGLPPSQITLSGPTAITTNSCSSVYTATLKDNQNNATIPSSDTTVTLSGASQGTFYSDSGCTTAITSFVIGTSSSTGSFYFKDPAGEALTLTATAGAFVGTLAITQTPNLASNQVLMGGYYHYGLINGAGTDARFYNPQYVTSDGVNLYVSETTNQCIRAMNLTTGIWSNLAGCVTGGYLDGTGSGAYLSSPAGLVMLGGFIYDVESGSHTVRKINPSTGTVTTIAGNNAVGIIDGTGSTARFNVPWGITTDGTVLYVADSTNHCIRKVTTAGVVTTVAGTCGSAASVVDSATAANVRFNYPRGITYAGGFLYVADWNGHTIRKVNPTTGETTTFAGQATAGWLDGTGTAAKFYTPAGLTTDGVNLYVSDYSTCFIRQVTLAGAVVTTIAGSGIAGSSDASPATSLSARFYNPTGIFYLGSNIYVADTNSQAVRKVDLITNTLSTVGGPNQNIFLNRATTGTTDGTGTAGKFNINVGHGGGNAEVNGILYFADYNNHTIRSYNVKTGASLTVAGWPTLAGTTNGTGNFARFTNPSGVVSDGTNLYITDHVNGCIRKMVLSSGVVTTLAGLCGTLGNVNDPLGSNVRLNRPFGMVLDSTNTYLYVTDYTLNQIKQIAVATGATTTFAGSGANGYTNGTGASAVFYGPRGITSDGTNLYITDYNNHVIRQITLAGAVVTTLVGPLTAVPGYVDATTTTARFYNPNSITINGTSLYVADITNNAVRKIDINTGVVTTFVGTGNRFLWGEKDDTSLTQHAPGPNGVFYSNTGLYIFTGSNLRLIH